MGPLYKTGVITAIVGFLVIFAGTSLGWPSVGVMGFLLLIGAA
jgi:hypothetical protein